MLLFPKLASLKYFYEWSGKLLPWLVLLCLPLLAYGLIGGLVLAPPDYQQGDGFRIMYVHVPCAILSLTVYTSIAVAAFISLVWRIKLADITIKASLPLGAWFTFLALITGSLWGKPMWGTWWIWDARLTSELILLFLYLGAIGLQGAVSERNGNNQAVNLLLLVGVVNIPIIHYSVNWWNTLHQANSLSLFAKPTIAPIMLYPLLAMLLAFALIFVITVLLRMRCEILWRERKSQWVQALILSASGSS
jgi:heme exporter protein C